MILVFWTLKYNISWNLKAKSATTNLIHFLNKIVILLASKWIRMYILCFFLRMISKFITAWYLVNSHKQIWNNVIGMIFVHYIAPISPWCCKKGGHLDCDWTSYNYFCLIWTHWKINMHRQYTSFHINTPF